MPSTTSSSFVYAIDWAALPADVQATFRELGHSIADRLPMSEIAERHGLRIEVVSRRLAAARAALVEQLLEREDDLDEGTRARLLVEVDALTKPR